MFFMFFICQAKTNSKYKNTRKEGVGIIGGRGVVGVWSPLLACLLVPVPGPNSEHRRDSLLPRAQVVVQSTLVSRLAIIIMVMVQSTTSIILAHGLTS